MNCFAAQARKKTASQPKLLNGLLQFKLTLQISETSDKPNLELTESMLEFYNQTEPQKTKP